MYASVSKVRDIFEISAAEDTAATKRQRYKRVTEGLIVKEVISIRETMVYLEA